jgi:uncharacterized membrane protein YidH (DUF202 family)
MDRNEDIAILLAEEQTFLSRERTMHSYMQTGLAFCSVGLLIMKFITGAFYFCAGVFSSSSELFLFSRPQKGIGVSGGP